MARWIDTAKAWARSVKRDVVALWMAARDPRTPIAAKLVAASVAAYALSPIDLIPDFIPVLGYLDDVVLVPLGILLAVRLIPPALMQEFRVRSEELQSRPRSRSGMFAIIVIWLGLAMLMTWVAWSYVPVDALPAR